ncbi:unnamed protein product [Gordionus sp. m RMFG-2023]
MGEKSDNDLALLKLTNELPISVGKIQELPMASGSFRIDETIGETCKVAGWGLTSFVSENTRPDILQELKLKYMSSDDCNKNYYAISRGITLTPNQFCSMQTSPLIKGTNRGDSGGPYMCRKDNKWKLVGVIKMGDTGVSYFMDVRKYMNWIWRITL